MKNLTSFLRASPFFSSLSRSCILQSQHCRFRRFSGVATTMGDGSGGDTVKLAICQMGVTGRKEKDLDNMSRIVNKVKAEGADLVLLPECFNCPYGNKYFPKYGEALEEGGQSYEALRRAAIENQVFLIGVLDSKALSSSHSKTSGSVPEFLDGKIFNTSLTFSPSGKEIARHRKLHLFDINVPGKIVFKESETLSAGSSPTFFDMNDRLRVGIGICYDIRFPELARYYADKGCTLLCYPGAFNMTTGPLHWELLQRARAVDNQLFVATASPAREPDADYAAWGHSTVVDPWGEVIAKLGAEASYRVVDLDLSRVKNVRESIPVLTQRRENVLQTSQ